MVFVTVRRVFQKIKLSKKQPERVLKIEFEADFVPKSFFSTLKTRITWKASKRNCVKWAGL